MKRSVCLAASVLVAAVSGCCNATCQNPWDYCNAVIGACGCPNCDFGARCGSAFVPIGGRPATTALGPTQAAAEDAGEAAEPEKTPEPLLEPTPPDELDLPDADMPAT